MTPLDQAKKRIGHILAGKWTVEEVLDIGGVAAVFAATDLHGRRVAIKMLHPTLAAEKEVRERFIREGYAANQVDHRGAVRITADGETDDGLSFLVMELLEGESVDKLIARMPDERVPCIETLAIAHQTLDVLDTFHARGVIHRDLKPANLFVTTPGIVKVLDFGFAQLRSKRTTARGMVLGTIAYMAPEQVSGNPADVDERTDLFEMGAVMFQMLTGRLFVEGKTMLERVTNVGKKPAPKIQSFMPELPDPVAHVVDRALAFEKKNRWESAAEMGNAVWSAHTALKREARKAGIKLESPSPVVKASFHLRG